MPFRKLIAFVGVTLIKRNHTAISVIGIGAVLFLFAALLHSPAPRHSSEEADAHFRL